MSDWSDISDSGVSSKFFAELRDFEVDTALEVAGAAFGPDHGGGLVAVGLPFSLQSVEMGLHGVKAPVPAAFQRREVAGNLRIGEFFRKALRRLVVVPVLLLMRLQVGRYRSGKGGLRECWGRFLGSFFLYVDLFKIPPCREFRFYVNRNGGRRILYSFSFEFPTGMARRSLPPRYGQRTRMRTARGKGLRLTHLTGCCGEAQCP